MDIAGDLIELTDRRRFGGGDASTLYTCHRGVTTSARCSGTCTLQPIGRDDHCS